MLGFYYIFALSIISRPLSLSPSSADTAKFLSTSSFMQGYWYVHSTMLLGGGPKMFGTEENVNLWNLLWILCCQTVFFTELFSYQNIFVYLILSRIVCYCIYVESFAEKRLFKNIRISFFAKKCYQKITDWEKVLTGDLPYLFTIAKNGVIIIISLLLQNTLAIFQMAD